MSNLTAPFDVPLKPGDEIRVQAAAVKNYRGGVAAIILGVGFATPLVVATAGMQFAGVYLEGNDNSNGVAGTINNGAPLSGLSSFVRLKRTGLACFNQSGITQASVGKNAYFSDDNTITMTPGAVVAGMVVTVDEANGKAWVCIDNAVTPIPNPVTGITVQAGDFTASAHTSAKFVLTKGSAAAVTLGAPTATTDDGVVLVFTSATAFAHVITATGLLQDGSTHTDTATFAAHPGATVSLLAYQGKWLVQFANGITFA